jgi:hypothetical protein
MISDAIYNGRPINIEVNLNTKTRRWEEFAEPINDNNRLHYNNTYTSVHKVTATHKACGETHKHATVACPSRKIVKH